MKITKTLVIAGIAMSMFSCENNEIESIGNESLIEIPTPEPIFMNIGNSMRSITKTDATGKSETFNVAIYSAEYITAGDSNEMGTTVFFQNNGKYRKLGSDFSPLVSPNGSSDISYYIDQNRPSDDLDVLISTAAIVRAMDTWDNVTCSELGLNETEFDANNDPGYVAAFVRDFLEGPDYGGSYDYFADVAYVGWMPIEFFNAVFGEGNNVLGVTFTLTYVDGNGNPLDSNNDGKVDTYMREIYYNDGYPWQDGNHFDIETIALHEAGHGISQGHFGKAFRTVNNGKLHFSPRAVMNATYSGIQTSITETDEGAHCSIWANYPNK